MASARFVIPVRRPLHTQFCLLLVLALLPALAAAWLHPRRPDWSSLSERAEEINVGQAQALVNGGKVLWIDARAREQFAAGHIPGALLLNEEQWESGLEGFVQHWQPGITVVVYCGAQDCHSSKQLARRIRSELGVETVLVLRGGWQAWQEATR